MAPVLAAIGNQTVNEGSAAQLHRHGDGCRPAGEDADLHSPRAGCRRAPHRPRGGAFTWTPTESQGGRQLQRHRHGDRQRHPASAGFETFKITVNEVNVAPVLAAIGETRASTRAASSRFTATATDADLPAKS